MITNRYLNQRMRAILYALKRQYGGTISIYQVGAQTTNYETGVRTIPKEVTVIRRAIILPTKVMREAVQTISVISANKKFVFGGSYDSFTRFFIVDRRDAPSLQLTESDYVVYTNAYGTARRYEVKDFQEFEFDSAWVVTGKAVLGEVPEQIFPVAADNLLRLDQGSTQS